MPSSRRPAADSARREVLADGLNSAAIHLLRRIRASDRLMGVSPSKASALSVLVFGGPCSLGALAAAEQVTAPSMSRTVAALEVEGYVTREADPHDARAVIISATAKARRVLQRGRRLRIEALAGELEALPPTDLEVLERAVEALRRLEAGSSR
jgi:DNA-binding MarR family transcriptional regulator